VRTAAHPALLIPAMLMWAWIGLVVFVAYRLHLWTADLIKDSVIWSIGPALGLFFNVTKLSKDPLFFRHTALSTIKYSVLIEFYVNLRVFSFPVELLVVLPGVTLLALLASFAGTNEKYRPAKRVLDVVLAFVGIAIALYVTVALVGSWRHEDPWHDPQSLLGLPSRVSANRLFCEREAQLYTQSQSSALYRSKREDTSRRQVRWRLAYPNW
jgi:hypothetical protein